MCTVLLPVDKINKYLFGLTQVKYTQLCTHFCPHPLDSGRNEGHTEYKLFDFVQSYRCFFYHIINLCNLLGGSYSSERSKNSYKCLQILANKIILKKFCMWELQQSSQL